MASLNEASVRVVVELVRDGVDQKLYVTGHSRMADGTPLRNNEKEDVTAFLNAQQIAAGLLILDAAEAYLKSKWEIS
ncbi:MAG TPA: hypothetical protein VLA89_02620 [Gemmatimonadales bacterium]|nr:hypothetical protein [Gemmatimonadales bacterium]